MPILRELPSEQFERIGMVARWKPVHLGHTPVLRALCGRGGEALIGIGSSNIYDVRSPFTLEETEAMIRLALDGYDNYRLLPVPDLFDGPRWRAMVTELFGGLDLFVTDNPYVASLLEKDYDVIRPVHLVPPSERVPISGTMVRQAMARGEDWQALVPAEIAAFIAENGLDRRFRREFGLETLAQAAMIEEKGG